MANLTDIKGVSESRAENLEDEGYTSVDDVASADAKGLAEVHGVGESTAFDLIDSAQEVLTEEHIDEEEDEEDREDVDLEDIEEINDEPPEGYEEPSHSDEEGDEADAEEEEVEEEGSDEPEVHPVELDVETAEQYDYLLKALIDMKLQRSSNSADRVSAMDLAIDAVRPLGGSGTAEVELTAVQLNNLHAAVQQAQQYHQNNRQVDAFEAVRGVKRQVDDQREEYLF